jgi:hypothetical protein
MWGIRPVDGVMEERGLATAMRFLENVVEAKEVLSCLGEGAAFWDAPEEGDDSGHASGHTPAASA